MRVRRESLGPLLDGHLQQILWLPRVVEWAAGKLDGVYGENRGNEGETFGISPWSSGASTIITSPQHVPLRLSPLALSFPPLFIIDSRDSHQYSRLISPLSSTYKSGDFIPSYSHHISYYQAYFAAIPMAEYVYARHDFVPEHEDEIAFRAGERIEVIERDDLYSDGWWQVSSLSLFAVRLVCGFNTPFLSSPLFILARSSSWLS